MTSSSSQQTQLAANAGQRQSTPIPRDHRHRTGNDRLRRPIGEHTPASQSSGTTTNAASQATLPANVSPTLGVIYNAYLNKTGPVLPATIPATNGANTVMIQGSNVGIQVQDSNPANFNTSVSDLQSAGHADHTQQRPVRNWSSVSCRSHSFPPSAALAGCTAA